LDCTAQTAFAMTVGGVVHKTLFNFVTTLLRGDGLKKKFVTTLTRSQSRSCVHFGNWIASGVWISCFKNAYTPSQ
ncbi:MAG: hypothetical protein FWB93_06080, partial [Oscillospiraceae bacterium]|nr:hypothetical protein [Oscillospiraceae bacterium]